MSYKLIYTIPFASLRDEACVVEIEKENYTGSSTELTGSDSPFEVNVEDDEFMYRPSRFSTARIRVVGSDYLQQLFSTSYQQYRVTFKRNGVISWCGFIKPEVYTQDYSSDRFELEIECMSAMSVLEFINYKQVGVDEMSFVTLWSLIEQCIDAAKAQYPSVYIPHVYAKDASDYVSGLNVFKDMTISEQNFFDEDGKPMKLKEILEEVCKLLNWTCVDCLGELYFVDMDHLGDYHKYEAGLASYSKYPIQPIINVQKIGFSGSDHSLDRTPGYNKVVVKTSNYPVATLIPEEDFPQKEVYDSYKTINDAHTEESYIQGVILKSWKLKAYGENFPLGSGDVFELTDEQVKATGARLNYNMLMGASAYRVGTADAERKDEGYRVTGANYSWKKLIRYRVNSSIAGKPILVANGAVAPYMNGAIGIEAGILFTTNYYEPHKVTITNNHVLRFSLRIGKEYWNGSGWQANKTTFDVGIGEIGKEVERTSIRGTKTADMPYDGLTGYIVKFPDDRVLVGDLELIMYAVNYPYQNDKRIAIVDIENLKLAYQKKDDVTSEENNSDRFYENVINEDYINELDEIEFKVSSYNNDGACYSKVLLGDVYLTDNLYSEVMKEQTRPEEQLIHRIVNRYSETHLKLTQVIKENKNITPLSRLSDNFLVGSIFAPIGGSINYKTGQYRCTMVDI